MNGRQLKEMIDKLGLTQRGLAELMEVTPQTINAILTAKDVRTSTVERIAAVTNMPISYFFNEERTEQNAVANGDSSIAINNSGSIATGDAAVLQERVTMLEKLIEEKERLINVLMEKNN